MRILALDHGSKRIGLALSDELRLIAFPIGFIAAEPFADFLAGLKAIIREREAGSILVGMPRNLDGTYGEAAARVREFVTVLKDAPVKPESGTGQTDTSAGTGTATWLSVFAVVLSVAALAKSSNKKK